MSRKNYDLAMEKAPECEDYYASEGVSEETVENAEKLLGVKFSPQLKSYLTEYDFIEFFGVELYGISKEDFSSSVLEGNIVEWALNERETNDFDPMWLPIRFEDDGGMAFLDCSQLNGEGEPPIILAEDNGDGYEFVEKLADDLGDYILELVNTQLEEQ